MTDEGAPLSPCVNVCTYDRALGFCTGCGRTLDEIGAWGRLTDFAKRRVVETAAERLGASRSPSL